MVVVGVARVQSLHRNRELLAQGELEFAASKRLEIRGRLGDAKETAEDPDFAIRNSKGVVFKYRKGYGMLKTAGLWLRLTEEEDSQGNYYVKTVYFTREIEEGEPLCIRRV